MLFQARGVAEKSLCVLSHALLKRRVQDERAHIRRLESDALATKAALKPFLQLWLLRACFLFRECLSAHLPSPARA